MAPDLERIPVELPEARSDTAARLVCAFVIIR
jgi:hypothetical protein